MLSVLVCRIDVLLTRSLQNEHMKTGCMALEHTKENHSGFQAKFKDLAVYFWHVARKM